MAKSESFTFTDSPFMSATEKALVLRQWKTFLKKLGERLARQDPAMERADYGSYPRELDQPFTDRLYKHLTLHCSFIAHYNRRGFLSHYFTDPNDTATFLRQFDTRGAMRGAELGMTYWACGEYGDINMAMAKVATPFIDGFLARIKQHQKARDLRAADMLASKHGYKVVPH